MVFQSGIPVAVGLAFTEWRLPAPAIVVACCAIVCAALYLGAIADVIFWRRSAGAGTIAG
jgi:hypothetical protein